MIEVYGGRGGRELSRRCVMAGFNRTRSNTQNTRGEPASLLICAAGNLAGSFGFLVCISFVSIEQGPQIKALWLQHSSSSDSSNTLVQTK